MKSEPSPLQWLFAGAIAALCVIGFHYRLALPGRALISNDMRGLFIALRAGLQNTVRAGEWPFWQRGIYLGYPILGDIQPALFDPLTWLTLPLSAARGVTVQSLAHLCIAALGMVFWMRQRGLRPLEGVFAAAVFALCLKQTVHLHHWTFAGSTCAWPFLFAGLDGFLRTGKGRYLGITSAGVAATWAGASPQMAWFGCMLAAAYALALFPALWRRRPSDAVLALLALPLGLALAAPLILPVQELSALGPRGAGVTYRFASSWSWPGAQIWPALLLPRAFGGRPDYRGPMNYWELQGYLGLLPMALCFAAPLRRQCLWLFAAAIGLAVWLSFGDSSFLGLHHFATRVLPGYGGFRNPTRALLPAALCASVLAAHGLGRLRDEPRLRGRILGVLAVLAIACGALWLRPGGYFEAALRLDAQVALGLLFASAIIVWLAPRQALFAALAVPLFLADVGFQTWDSPELGPAAAEGKQLAQLAAQLAPAPAPRRVAVLMPWGAFNNATYQAGLEGVTGYGPTPLFRVLALYQATATGRVPKPAPLDDDVNFIRPNLSSELLPLLASPMAVAGAEARPFALPALPRVFFTSAFTVAADDQVELLLHRAARGELAVLAEQLPGLSVQPDQPGGQPLAASEIEVRTNSLSATVNAPQDGVAVILDPFYPGWTATVDGEPAPLLRADLAFEAVPLRKGVHKLVLRYFPKRLVPGLVLSLLAALTLLLILHQRSSGAHLPATLRRVDTPSLGGYVPAP